MDNRAVMWTRKQFLESLRGALNHLYDPEYLSRCPLAEPFGVSNRYDTPTALRRILTEAIERLEPSPSEPPHSRAWRLYYALRYLYVEQLTQEEAADQLAISPRQLRREQRAALEQLAERLWEEYKLETLTQSETEKAPAASSVETGASLHHELTWVRDRSRATDLGEQMPAIIDLASRLAAEAHTRLESRTEWHKLPRIAVHPVAFRQIVLNVLSVAIRRATDQGKVCVSAGQNRWEVEMDVRCVAPLSELRPMLSDEATSLNLAQQLIELSGGRLDLNADAKTFHARLTFAALEQLPVLAIDDHADTLALFQRYAAGTRYRIIPTQNPEEAIQLATEHRPQVIVLDVMMPEMDGWEVLSRLRQHPATAQVPIIVCTILAQKELALLLGASDYVRKPVTQAALLAALDRQVTALLQERASH